MNNNVLASFSNKNAGSSGEYWLHLEQVLPEEITPTLGEVATLVDKLFGVDPCGDYDDIEETPFNAEDDDYSDIPDDIHKENAIVARKAAAAIEAAQFFLDTVKTETDMNLCLIDANSGDYEVQIKVGKSHKTENYVLRVISGSVGSTSYVRENFKKVYDVEKQDSIDLPFPVLTDGVFTFENVVLGPYGYQTGPGVTLSGRTLSWEGQITGKLSVAYETEYDLVTLTVFGKDDGTDADDSVVLGFYHNALESLSLEKPESDEDATQIDIDNYCSESTTYSQLSVPPNSDVVTCYEEVKTNYMCRCEPDQVAYSTDTIVTVPCPSSNMKCLLGFGTNVDGHDECSMYMGSRTVIGGYVACSEQLYNIQGGALAANPEHDEISEPYYYEQKCCEAPLGELPLCISITKSNNGKSLEESVVADYERKYGAHLQMVPLSPADGDCGTITTTVIVPNNDCCEFVVDLAINEEYSATVIADNSSGLVYLADQSPNPIKVTVSGEGFFADGGLNKVAYYEENWQAVYVFTQNACGSATVTITDGCSTAVHYLRTTEGQWVVVTGEEATLVWDAVKGMAGEVVNSLSDYVDVEVTFGEYTVLERHVWLPSFCRPFQHVYDKDAPYQCSSTDPCSSSTVCSCSYDYGCFDIIEQQGWVPSILQMTPSPAEYADNIGAYKIDKCEEGDGEAYTFTVNGGLWDADWSICSGNLDTGRIAYPRGIKIGVKKWVC